MHHSTSTTRAKRTNRGSRLLAALPTLALPFVLSANNIQVSNVTLTGQNAVADTWQVQFDISWDNSWYVNTAPANGDAAWVFIKYRFGMNSDWRHATLSPSGSIAPAGSVLIQSADNKGGFIRRSTFGTGTSNFTGVQMRWNYAGTGVQDTDPIDVRVLAIEMVNIPSGAYMLGDGTATNVRGQFEQGQTGSPYLVSSEAAITLGGAAATSLNARNNTGLSNLAPSALDDFTYTTTQTLPTTYPKGYNAFYMMKYEMSEAQYVEFLNLLTPAQAAAGFPDATGVSGHTIDDNGISPNLYVTTAPDRACATNANNQLAYADWAALRPMTELEYEKACRGPMPALADEYAWGTAEYTTNQVSLNGAGTPTESAAGSLPIANIAGAAGNYLRPWRVAAVASGVANPTRTQAGASYYGVNELSGNLREWCVGVTSPSARAFSGAINGDGALSAAGATDVANWNTIAATVGATRLRGGSWAGTSPEGRVSDRRASLAIPATHSVSTTIRLCRLP
ncbi:MAG: SUMF1/EgtB/PvdO family nonheme iron enzyme [Flavobacteriales bacterium]|nr:MAG: SUMF1/EgtB/PvdO family nonheme iron enzyme [Flavobacteriales bacterium]